MEEKPVETVLDASVKELEAAASEPKKKKSRDKSKTPAHRKRRELQEKLAGQPRPKPDWKIIDALRLGGWTVAQLAEHFQIPPDTIYRRHWKNGISKRAAANVGRISTEEYLSDALVKKSEELWKQRAEEHRATAYAVAKKVMDYAASPEVPASTLLPRMQGIKFADEIGRRATGLDKAEEMNAAKVQIAFLTQSDVEIAEVPAEQEVSVEGDLS